MLAYPALGSSTKAAPWCYCWKFKMRSPCAETLYREGQLSVQQIAEKLHIAKSTLYVYLRHRGVAIGALQQPLLPSPAPPRSHPSASKPPRRTGAARAAGHP
jgi:hypothetical protein